MDDVASVAHDLRNPLIVLVGASRRLAGPPQPEATRTQLIGMVERSSADIEALIDQLLRIASINEIEYTLERKPVDFSVVFDDLTRQAAEIHAVDVEIEVGPGTVYSDERAIRRIVQNLLDNAIRHGAAPFRLTLTCSPTAVQIRVVDHGPDIDEATRATLFRRFHPGHAASSGTGLGLNIVQQLANALGGRVDLFGDGATTFCVELPQRSR